MIAAARARVRPQDVRTAEAKYGLSEKKVFEVSLKHFVPLLSDKISPGCKKPLKTFYSVRSFSKFLIY